MLPQTQYYIACLRVKKLKGFNNNNLKKKDTYDMNALKATAACRPYLLFTRIAGASVR